jgi:hypothetical protein
MSLTLSFFNFNLECYIEYFTFYGIAATTPYYILVAENYPIYNSITIY